MTGRGVEGPQQLALSSPFEVTGAAHTAESGLDGAPVTMIRVEGSEASVAYRAGSGCRRHCWPISGTVSVSRPIPERTASLAGPGYAMWLRSMTADGEVWRLSVKPSDAPRHRGAPSRGASTLRLGRRSDLAAWFPAVLWPGLAPDIRDAIAQAVPAVMPPSSVAQ